MVEVSRMHQNLKETFHTLTVLVPTDTVLKRIPQSQLQRILNNETLSKGTNANSICINMYGEYEYINNNCLYIHI